jgi:hypothetical protein
MELNDKFVRNCDRTAAFSFYVMAFFLAMAPALIESFFAVMMFSYVFKRSRLYCLQSKQRPTDHQEPWGLKLKRFLLAYKPIENALNAPIGIFVCVSILSIVFNAHWGVGWKGFFCKLWESIFIYFIFIETMQTRQRQVRFLIGVPAVLVSHFGERCLSIHHARRVYVSNSHYRWKGDIRFQPFQ